MLSPYQYRPLPFTKSLWRDYRPRRKPERAPELSSWEEEGGALERLSLTAAQIPPAS